MTCSARGRRWSILLVTVFALSLLGNTAWARESAEAAELTGWAALAVAAFYGARTIWELVRRERQPLLVRGEGEGAPLVRQHIDREERIFERLDVSLLELSRQVEGMASQQRQIADLLTQRQPIFAEIHSKLTQIATDQAVLAERLKWRITGEA